MNRAESDEEGVTVRDDSKRAEPEPPDVDAALKVAIKAAIDAGQWERAEALMTIAKSA